MKNLAALTLKSFLVALVQQATPLSQEQQAVLHDIGRSLQATSDIGEPELARLNQLAEDSANLADPYEAAWNWLSQAASERKMGLGVEPNAQAIKQDALNPVLDNTASSTEHLRSLPEIAKPIEKFTTQQVIEASTQAFTAEDPVQAMKDHLEKYVIAQY